MSYAHMLGTLFGGSGVIQSALGGTPAGVVLPFAGATAPTGWLLCHGQTVSRVTYASLFAVLGTVYGAGDGSTTFHLPDMRGRVAAGKDNMGGAAAGRLSSPVAGSNLGAAGGSQNHTLTSAESGMPSHGHSATSTPSLSASSAGAHTHKTGTQQLYAGYYGEGTATVPANYDGWSGFDSGSSGAHTHSVTGTVATAVSASGDANASSAHPNVQPTIILNYIIRAA